MTCKNPQQEQCRAWRDSVKTESAGERRGGGGRGGGITGGWPQSKAEGWPSPLKSSLFMRVPLDVLDICVNIPSLFLAAAGGYSSCFQRHGSLRETADVPRGWRRRPRAAEMKTPKEILQSSPGVWQHPEVVEVMRVNENKQVFRVNKTHKCQTGAEMFGAIVLLQINQRVTSELFLKLCRQALKEGSSLGRTFKPSFSLSPSLFQVFLKSFCLPLSPPILQSSIPFAGHLDLCGHLSKAFLPMGLGGRTTLFHHPFFTASGNTDPKEKSKRCYSDIMQI